MVSLPAKVILTTIKAMQMVSTAQSLAKLASNWAESTFAHVNGMLFGSEQYSVRIVN